MKKKIITVAALSVALLVSAFYLLSPTDNKREQMCEETIKLLFNCPQEDIIFAWQENFKNGGVSYIGTGERKETGESTLPQFIKEKTHDYFSEDQREKFAVNYLFNLHLFAEEGGVKTTCQKVQLSKKTPHDFDFETAVTIENNGETKQAQIKGSVSFDKEGKINYFMIFDGLDFLESPM